MSNGITMGASVAERILFIFQFFAFLLYYYIDAFVRTFFLRPKRKNVSGDIVLVTGGGHGIGREIALEFGRLGAKVVLWDMNKSTNDATAEEIKSTGGIAYAYVCNLCKTDDIKTMAKRVRQEVGDVSILVNNAGILYGGEVLKMKEEHIRQTFEVNILSHFWTVKEFLPAMMKVNKGHIVTISSMSAKSGTAFLVDYSSSKYAAFGFAESLNEEVQRLGYTGIHSTTVCPMFVNTGLVKKPTDRFGRILEPRECAMAVVNGTLVNQEVVYVPSSLSVSLRITQLFPRKFNVWMKKAGKLGIEQQYDVSGEKRD